MTQVQDLSGRWQGSGSAAFQQLFQEWQSGASMTQQGMEGIAKFLSQAAEAYAQTDSNVQSAASH
jgi:WXG100 family type VII secretion target